MASIVMAYFMLQLLVVLPEIKAVTVKVTSPIHPVTVGGILAVKCDISSLESRHIVKIVGVTRMHTEEIWSAASYSQFAIGQRAFVSKRSLPGGNSIYFMTIPQVSLQDQGRYVCKVGHYVNANYVTLADDSIDVDIYYLPDRVYPQCQSNPDNTKNLAENVDLRLTCISSKGIPTVSLRWITNQDVAIISVDKAHDDTVSSEMTIRTSASHDGSVFVCELTSSGFKDLKRTCQIGPITVRRNTDTEHRDLLPPKITTERNFQSDQSDQKITLLSGDCKNECTSNDTFTILYLSVATIGATMLWIVFLTTTIIWCCKYRRASAEIKRAQRNIKSSDGSEPVYVSLQTRPGIESNSMLMSVDNPNNPGDKVTMPKEVYD